MPLLSARELFPAFAVGRRTPGIADMGCAARRVALPPILPSAFSRPRAQPGSLAIARLRERRWELVRQQARSADGRDQSSSFSAGAELGSSLPPRNAPSITKGMGEPVPDAKRQIFLLKPDATACELFVTNQRPSRRLQQSVTDCNNKGRRRRGKAAQKLVVEHKGLFYGTALFG